MKILVIGSKGMLGQELLRVLAEGNEIVGWDKEEIDITEAESAKRKVQSLRPQLLINAAAYNEVDRAEAEPEAANKVNGHAVGQLAAACRGLDIPMVHFSTEYVFDGEKEPGYREDDEPSPLSAYGRSKFLGEQELQHHTDKFYLIRLSRLFGVSGGGKKSFVEVMLELANSKSEIEVVDGELSCPTYAVDLAERTKWIIENEKPGIYHAANAGACTWFGFASEIFKISKKNVKLIPVAADRFPRAAKRPRYGILLNTKLPQMRPWQEALEEFLISNFRFSKK